MSGFTAKTAKTVQTEQPAKTEQTVHLLTPKDLVKRGSPVRCSRLFTSYIPGLKPKQKPSQEPAPAPAPELYIPPHRRGPAAPAPRSCTVTIRITDLQAGKLLRQKGMKIELIRYGLLEEESVNVSQRGPPTRIVTITAACSERLEEIKASICDIIHAR